MISLGDEMHNGGYTSFSELCRELVKKWKATGLLDDVNHEEDMIGLATLFENEVKYLLNEGMSISEENCARFAALVFPVIKKFFNACQAIDINLLGAMPLPAALVMSGEESVAVTAATKKFEMTEELENALQKLFEYNYKDCDCPGHCRHSALQMGHLYKVQVEIAGTIVDAMRKEIIDDNPDCDIHLYVPLQFGVWHEKGDEGKIQLKYTLSSRFATVKRESNE